MFLVQLCFKVWTRTLTSFFPFVSQLFVFASVLFIPTLLSLNLIIDKYVIFTYKHNWKKLFFYCSYFSIINCTSKLEGREHIVFFFCILRVFIAQNKKFAKSSNLSIFSTSLLQIFKRTFTSSSIDLWKDTVMSTVWQLAAL